MRDLNVTRKKCKNSAGKVFNKSQNVSTCIFSTQVDAHNKKSLLRDFAHTDHSALMTLEEHKGKQFGECAVVMQLFFKKTVRHTHSKKIFHTMYNSLLRSLEHPSKWSLQLAGYNFLRLGIFDDGGCDRFMSTDAVELMAQGLLFRNERFKG